MSSHIKRRIQTSLYRKHGIQREMHSIRGSKSWNTYKGQIRKNEIELSSHMWKLKIVLHFILICSNMYKITDFNKKSSLKFDMALCA